MDLKNLVNKAELKAQDRQEQLMAVEQQIQQLTDQQRKAEDQLFKVQNQRLKEVTSLAQQRDMMEESIQSNKLKLTEKTDFGQINTLYKRLK